MADSPPQKKRKTKFSFGNPAMYYFGKPPIDNNVVYMYTVRCITGFYTLRRIFPNMVCRNV